MMAVCVKVCGITNIEDAEQAVECGASYLGLIFVAASPRCIPPEAAKDFAGWQEKRPTPLVGVFKDPSLSQVRSAMDLAPISFVQLHGHESVEFCRSIDLPVIKTIEIDPHAADALAALRRQMAVYSPVAQHFLFDKPKDFGKVGAGAAATNDLASSAADWLFSAVTLLQQAMPVPLPFFFAGGLNAGNVAQVIAQLQPFAVDVASGIEARPGAKDLGKMQAFFQSALQHSAEAPGGLRS